MGLARLPSDVRWIHLIGVALLGGIGFTMSIFITNLALTDPELITGAKMSILTASLLAALLGLTVLKSIRMAYKPKGRSQEEKQPRLAN